MAQVDPENKDAFRDLTIKLLYITMDLRRADGPDAWERIPDSLD